MTYFNVLSVQLGIGRVNSEDQESIPQKMNPRFFPFDNFFRKRNALKCLKRELRS